MHLSTWQLISEASFVVKLILAMLAGLSVVSWALILYKYLVLLTASRQSQQFLAEFEAGHDLAKLDDLARSHSNSPPARVFHAAYEARESPAIAERRVRNTEVMELERLQSYLTFLATTASAAPFIGLLGTVWGIMDAFRGIGIAGSASLAVLAPAIAEALIATAAGLLAAIPAVVAYNALLNWTRKMAIQVEDFADHVQERLKEQPHHETRVPARARV